MSEEIEKAKLELEERRLKLEESKFTHERKLQLGLSSIDELDKHRQYLQVQLRNLIRGVSVLIIVAAGIFTYFFNSSFDDLEEVISTQIEAETIKYSILKSYRNNLEKHLEAYANSDEIGEMIKANAESVLKDEILLNMDTLVNAAIAGSTKELESSDVKSLINRSLSKVKWIIINSKNEEHFDLECEYKWACTTGDHKNITFYATSISEKSIRSYTANSYVVVGHDNKGEYHGDGDGELVLYKRCR
ncbi:MAG: hypothetical protein ABJF04_07950 [Reichenbachiella sp.]|uniref:hypothetical protein n=1 Tax=Reichenbachiella sp. TaxID=2184521 RepID=UPI0032644C1B